MAGISCWHAEPGLHEEVRVEAGEAGADSLAAVRRDLGSKIAELERRVKLLEESSGSPDKDLRLAGDESAPEAGIDEDDEARYEFTMSMWDAGILLFVHKNTHLDRSVLVLGMVLNVVLQAFVFFVIVYNLLDNDFSDKTIQEMVSWRVQHGHNGDNFNIPEGKSYAAQLCAHQLWSFEGQEYGDMYSYLYREVPGAYLSILAILLWILSTMAEYRKSVSQFLALMHLPQQRPHEECLSEDPSGDLRVCGISSAARWAAILLICLPRIVVALALMLIGCKYLAQTVTLSDIVLNTVALAFVMDVDEYLANVILTDRLQSVCGKIQSVRCGRKKIVPVRDLLRYVMIFGMLFFAIQHWVKPFNDAVAAASAALCGGDLDFSYVGGTSLHPDITLMPATRIFDEYTATCPTDLNLTYYGTYYPGYSQPNGTSADVPGGGGAPRSVEEELLLQVVRHAFSADGCGPGMIRGPPADTSSEDLTIFQRIFDDSGVSKKVGRGTSAVSEVRCIPLPARLRGVLPGGMHPGEDPVAEDCQGFDASLRGGACAEPEHPGVCVWTWEAQACEGTMHPGALFRSACRSSLWRECETWEGGFNSSHPTKNCEIARHCSPEAPRCLVMDGWVGIAASDASAFAGAEETLRALFSEAFKAAVNVSDPWSIASFYVVVAGSPIYHAMRQSTGTDGQLACNNSCQSPRNGVCDEPLACAPGTDSFDCMTCPFDCLDMELVGGSAFQTTCTSYYGSEAQCGKHDTARFAAGAMCCACGGGIRRERYVAGCAEQGAGCILAFYRLVGVGEDLRREEVPGLNTSIVGRMNARLLALMGGSDVKILRALFDEASIRVYPSAPGAALAG